MGQRVERRAGKTYVSNKSLGFIVFLYEDQTRKYDPKANEKHPMVRSSRLHELQHTKLQALL